MQTISLETLQTTRKALAKLAKNKTLVVTRGVDNTKRTIKLDLANQRDLGDAESLLALILDELATQGLV